MQKNEECKNERSELFAEARAFTGKSGRIALRDKSRTCKKPLRLIFALLTGAKGGSGAGLLSSPQNSVRHGFPRFPSCRNHSWEAVGNARHVSQEQRT
ncbi:MAG: hypothetical protein DRI57_21895 [Deltaproteobacteria bacterium]|nr:MAG: hypothetical protein DRI57_21895 [Deltaproteobacteria bacterium]